MKKVINALFGLMFSICFPFACISSNYDPYHSFYFGPHTIQYTYARYAVIAVILIILVYLNRKNEEFLTYYTSFSLFVVSVLVYIDYFKTHRFVYNYYYLFMLGVAISVAAISVFVGATLFLKNNYDEFFRYFWISYLVIYVLIFYVAFVRAPDSYGLTVNTQLGNGTLKFFKYIFRGQDSLYLSYICFGNIFILTPLPFIIRAVFKKAPIWIILIIGFLVPFIIEGYQYIFKCGNVDIDDLVLNWLGYLIGTGLMLLISKRKKLGLNE